MSLRQELCNNVKSYNEENYGELLLELKEEVIEASKNGKTEIKIKIDKLPFENLKYWCKENGLMLSSEFKSEVKISWN